MSQKSSELILNKHWNITLCLIFYHLRLDFHLILPNYLTTIYLNNIKPMMILSHIVTSLFYSVKETTLIENYFMYTVS